jgi:hypothetical protein
MTAVSNTSPVNYLVLVGLADFLPRIISELLIPRAVPEELPAPSAPAAAGGGPAGPRLWPAMLGGNASSHK